MFFTGEPHYQSSGRPVSAVRSVTGSWPAPDRHRPAGRSPRIGAGGVIPWTSVRAHCVSASQMYMLHVFLPALWSPSQSEGMGAPGGLWVPDRFLRLLGPGTPELARTCCISDRGALGQKQEGAPSLLHGRAPAKTHIGTEGRGHGGRESFLCFSRLAQDGSPYDPAALEELQNLRTALYRMPGRWKDLGHKGSGQRPLEIPL